MKHWSSHSLRVRKEMSRISRRAYTPSAQRHLSPAGLRLAFGRFMACWLFKNWEEA